MSLAMRDRTLWLDLSVLRSSRKPYNGNMSRSDNSVPLNRKLMSNRRLRRIFRPDGHTFIVAIDHGMTEGPVPGLETLEAIIPAIIARGADAVVVSAFPGTPQEELSLRSMAATIAEAHRWGLPVMGEMAPGGFDAGPEFRTPEVVAIAARVASELGADWLKLPYTENYQQVVRASLVPVAMLGGVKSNDPRVILASIHAALQAGAAGVALGRNIFQAEDPGGMTRAIAAIIHAGASVDKALEILRSESR